MLKQLMSMVKKIRRSMNWLFITLKTFQMLSPHCETSFTVQTSASYLILYLFWSKDLISKNVSGSEHVQDCPARSAARGPLQTYRALHLLYVSGKWWSLETFKIEIVNSTQNLDGSATPLASWEANFWKGICLSAVAEGFVRIYQRGLQLCVVHAEDV